MEHTAIIRKMAKTSIAEADDGASGRGSVGIDSAKPRDKKNPALESMLVKRTELRQNMATESTYICKSDIIVFHASLPGNCWRIGHFAYMHVQNQIVIGI